MLWIQAAEMSATEGCYRTPRQAAQRFSPQNVVPRKRDRTRVTDIEIRQNIEEYMNRYTEIMKPTHIDRHIPYEKV